jgi:hypothetical protein
MVLTDVVHVNTNNCIYDMQMPCKCKSLKFTRLNFLHLYCCCAHTCIYIYIYIYIYILHAHHIFYIVLHNRVKPYKYIYF